MFKEDILEEAKRYKSEWEKRARQIYEEKMGKTTVPNVPMIRSAYILLRRRAYP